MKLLAMKNSVIAAIGRFAGNCAGNVTIITGLAAIPLIAAAGIALDYSRGTRVESELQQIADSAALAAAAGDNISGTASQKAAQRTAIAQSYLDAHLAGLNDATIVGSPAITVGANTIDVVIEANVKGSLVNVLNAQGNAGTNIGISVNVTAGWTDAQNPACITTLDPSANGAFTLISSSELNASECDVNVLSTSNMAAKVVSPSATTFKKICAKGGVSGSLPSLTPNCTPAGDNYGKFMPIVTIPAACNSKNAVLSNATITPPADGYVFCGNNTLVGGGTTTLNPGLYIVKDGTLNFTGKVVHGTDVTFYFASTASDLTYVAKEDSYLKAPTSGTYNGILLFMPPGLGAKTVHIGSADKSYFEGIFYAPSWNLIINSSSDWGISKVNMVVNTFTGQSMSKFTWQTYSSTYPDGSGGDKIVRLLN